jgi:ketosteroid isomerase-like protein
MLVTAVLTLVLAAPETNEQLREQVRQIEIAFAKTMAARDHAGFVSFLAGETVFMGRTTLRGKGAVAEAWKRFYEAAAAPFAWEPDRVEVLDSGRLGITSGPVWDPSHNRIGTFNSVWRREDDGRWRIIFDIGCPPCAAAASPSPSPPPRP